MGKLGKLRDICFGRFTLTSHQQMEFERLIRFCRNQSTGLRNILLSISRWSVSLMCRSPDHLLARLLCHSHRETLVGAVHTPAVARWDKLDPDTPNTPDTQTLWQRWYTLLPWPGWSRAESSNTQTQRWNKIANAHFSIALSSIMILLGFMLHRLFVVAWVAPGWIDFLLLSSGKSFWWRWQQYIVVDKVVDKVVDSWPLCTLPCPGYS